MNKQEIERARFLSLKYQGRALEWTCFAYFFGTLIFITKLLLLSKNVVALTICASVAGCVIGLYYYYREAKENELLDMW